MNFQLVGAGLAAIVVVPIVLVLMSRGLSAWRIQRQRDRLRSDWERD